MHVGKICRPCRIYSNIMAWFVVSLKHALVFYMTANGIHESTRMIHGTISTFKAFCEMSSANSINQTNSESQNTHTGLRQRILYMLICISDNTPLIGNIILNAVVLKDRYLRCLDGLW